MKKIVLGFVGEIASGKGTVCQYLIDQYHASSYRFSTILRDVLDRLHLEHSRDNMQRLSTGLRQTFNEELLAIVMAEDVKNDQAEIICVDGIRRLADIVYLEKIPNFHLIHVYAEEKTRYQRIIERAENADDKNKTFEQFQKEHLRETELTIPQVTAKATIKINNNGQRENLYRELDQLIKKLQN